MKRNYRWLQHVIFTLIIIVGALTIASSMFNSDKSPTVGDKAPNFKLLGLDGKVHQLSDYRGKAMLVNFWGTYCGPCKEEMPAIQKQFDKWTSSNFVVLGVNMGESAITAKAFAEQVNAQFPILLDENEEIRKRYGVIQYPTSFFIQPDGRIKKVRVGQMDEGYIESTIKELIGK